MSPPFVELPPPLSGARLLQTRRLQDKRGDFIKTYHAGFFAELGLPFSVAEEYYSVSRRNVIRGMHFQVPPAEHWKLVYCVRGRVLDVVLDLRRGSPHYGRAGSCELSAANACLLVIPPGVAHGFAAREDESVLVYKTTSVHSPAHDAGVRWDSFGFNWEISAPIVSDRDAAFPAFADFSSPFS